MENMKKIEILWVGLADRHAVNNFDKQNFLEIR
jgi:hypothetical protein